jgi:hypothetical protein
VLGVVGSVVVVVCSYAAAVAAALVSFKMSNAGCSRISLTSLFLFFVLLG